MNQNLKLSNTPDTATRTSQTCYSSLLSINGNAYFENLVDYSLPNDFSRSPTLGGKNTSRQSLFSRQVPDCCLQKSSICTCFRNLCQAYLFIRKALPPLFTSFVYFRTVSHSVSTLTEQSQPSCKMTTLGCQVYIFYYTLVNEHKYYNLKFFIFQVKALRSANRTSVNCWNFCSSK